MSDPDRDVDTDELATWLGISERAVRDCAQRGVLERSYRGRWPLQGSIQRYCQHLRRLVVERSGGEGTAAARARLLEEQTKHAALKNARLEGSLLDRDSVQAEWSGILTQLRSRLLAVPSRLTAADVTPATRAAVDREIRLALEALADGAADEVENQTP